MSVAAKKWVRKHSPTRGRARAVLAELAWAGDDAGRGAYLSTSQLAKATGLGRSTVKRAVAELEEAQLIIRHRGDRTHCQACAQSRGAHVFDVVMPDLSGEDGELSNPDQMSLEMVHVNQVQDVGVVQGGPGSWSTVDQQEEIEDSSPSLRKPGSAETAEEQLLSLDANVPQPPARTSASAGPRARGVARRKPVHFRGRKVSQETVAAAEQLLEAFNESAGVRLGSRTLDGRPSPALKQIVGALIDRPDEPVDVWERGVRAMLDDPPTWIEGRIMVGHLFGQRAAEHTIARGRQHGQVAGRRASASVWGAIADELEEQEAAA